MLTHDRFTDIELLCAHCDNLISSILIENIGRTVKRDCPFCDKKLLLKLGKVTDIKA